MKLKALIYPLLLTVAFTSNADTLSITAGGGSWSESSSGNIRSTTDTTRVDVTDQLYWGDESQGYFFVTLEHPVPILPNVRILHTKLDQSGSGNASFTFDGVVYNGYVSNDFAMDTTDIIAYYEVLDNVVSIDLGLNIRTLNIDYKIVDSTNAVSDSDSVSGTFPMLYAMAGASPLPGLTISGEISYIGYSGSSISDFTAKIAYTTNFFVGVEAGYRSQSFELDDVSDTDANLDFDGMFVGAYVKF